MDDKLYQIEQQKQQAINNSNNTYQNLLNDNQALFDKQQEMLSNQERISNELLDRQLENQRRKIEQQKETARENYQTEQKRAKNDYLGFTNKYGVQAESFADRGLLNSGVSETSKLGGYNALQNRVSAANKVMQDAILQYDNDLNDAILNNDVQKAQNALNRLQMQMQYSQEFYNNNSTLKQNQLSNNQGLDNDYFNRYQTEYSNIQAEKQRQEAIRQWEQQFAYQKEQDKIAQQQWQKEYNLSKAKARTSSGSSLSGISLKDASDNEEYEANADPMFYSNDARDYYYKNFVDNMSKQDLIKKVAKGIKDGKFTDEEANNIYICYGLQ